MLFHVQLIVTPHIMVYFVSAIEQILGFEIIDIFKKEFSFFEQFSFNATKVSIL